MVKTMHMCLLMHARTMSADGTLQYHSNAAQKSVVNTEEAAGTFSEVNKTHEYSRVYTFLGNLSYTAIFLQNRERDTTFRCLVIGTDQSHPCCLISGGKVYHLNTYNGSS